MQMTLPFTYCQWVRPYALIESDSSSHSISFFSYVKLKSLILTAMYLQNMYNLLKNQNMYLAHVIEQPNLRIPKPQYLQLNFCFDLLMILRTH